MAAALPAPSLPESTTSTGSYFQSEEFVYDHQFVHQLDQNVVSNKRKGSTIVEKAFQAKHACSQTHYNYHYHSSQPNPGEMLSNLKINLSVNTYDLCGPIVPSLCMFPSSQFGYIEEYQQLQIPTTSEDEVLQVYSPPFISPDTSESNYFSEWESNSSPSLDFTVDQDDSDYYFKVNNSFF
ncbi:WRKY53 [Artemisia annua]|uniref:WRKY53 n=1 Tax=Artemisia annua TaxID=35608 RepID=A0A2U1L060_ARTAN|nr:WRKY53 [Artemisia annua]